MPTLEEIREKFPIGTKFICKNTSVEAIITKNTFKIKDGIVNEVDEKDRLMGSPGAYHCLYSNGEYTTILNTPIVYQIY